MSHPDSPTAIVRRFYFPYQAHIARAELEAEGIPAWVYDEHQVQMRWFMAHELGGVKVVVRPSDEARAREILDDDRSALAIEAATRATDDREEESCSRCGSGDLRADRRRAAPSPWQWVEMLWLLVLAVPAPERRHKTELTCQGCGHSWVERVERG